MQLISKFNKEFRFLLCVIDVYSEYAWVISLKDKKGIQLLMLYKGKSVFAETFIRTLKIKIYKYMISVSKRLYVDKLDDINNKYNKTYHSTIKMKSVVVYWITYISSTEEINDKDAKFNIVDTEEINDKDAKFNIVDIVGISK